MMQSEKRVHNRLFFEVPITVFAPSASLLLLPAADRTWC